MNDTTGKLKTWWGTLSPFAQDLIIASGIFLFLFVQAATNGLSRPHEIIERPDPDSIARSVEFGRNAIVPWARNMLSMVLLLFTCIPLVFRRKFPWPVLLLTVLGATAYTIFPLNPILIVAAPMLAIYTVAANDEKNTWWLAAFIGVSLVGCVLAITYATQRWAIELVGFLALFTAASLFGSVRRSTQAYVQAVELRALEAERTREEEALRRVESERVGIARDVHDIVAHSLSIIAIQAAAADALIDKRPEDAHKSLATIRDTSKSALSELRSMIDVLRGRDENAPLEPTHDLASLSKVIERVESAGIEVYLTQDITQPINASVSVSAYRIIQEALTNTMRHSNATQAEISLVERDGSLHIRVCDNGVFDPETVGTSGHGLEGMRERCEALNGTFSSYPLVVKDEHSAANFCIEATLPISNHSKE